MENFKIDELQNQLENLKIMQEKVKVSDVNYKRPKLIKLSKKEEDVERGFLFGEETEGIYNSIITNFGKQKLTEHSVDPKNLEFYFYNCESIQDYGWGCAWRCIQTLIGSVRNYLLNEEAFEESLSQFQDIINLDSRFDSLFYSYGSKHKLYDLFLSCYKFSEIPEFLTKKEFAPFETENGWAEPFHAKLILHDLGVSGKLFLLNHYSQAAFAPEEVFENVLNYEQFSELLINHFSKKHCLPIIIDDTLVTICIIGANKNESNSDYLDLLIADPHVKDASKAETGIFHVTLDERGNFRKDLNTHPMLNGHRLNFEKGSFMIFQAQL